MINVRKKDRLKIYKIKNGIGLDMWRDRKKIVGHTKSHPGTAWKKGEDVGRR